MSVIQSRISSEGSAVFRERLSPYLRDPACDGVLESALAEIENLFRRRFLVAGERQPTGGARAA